MATLSPGLDFPTRADLDRAHDAVRAAVLAARTVVMIATKRGAQEVKFDDSPLASRPLPDGSDRPGRWMTIPPASLRWLAPAAERASDFAADARTALGLGTNRQAGPAALAFRAAAFGRAAVPRVNGVVHPSGHEAAVFTTDALVGMYGPFGLLTPDPSLDPLAADLLPLLDQEHAAALFLLAPLWR